MSISPGFPPRYSKSVVFVDGGFVEKLIEKRFPDKQIPVRLFLSQVLLPLNQGRGLNQLELVRTYWYDAVPDDLEGIPKELMETVRKKTILLEYIDEWCENVDVKRGIVKFSSKNGLRQKGVDVFMGADIALNAWTGRIDDIVLVAQDGDFVPAVEVAKRAMVKVHLITDMDGLSIDLKKAADTYFPKLGDWLEQSKMLYDPSQITDGGGIPSSLTILKTSKGKV